MFKADHGFACIVNFEGEQILFDAGTDNRIFLENLKNSGVNEKNIKKVFISHNHNDHTGGLFDFVSLNSEVKIYMYSKQTQNELSNSKNIVLSKIVLPSKIDSAYIISKSIFSTGFLGNMIKEQAMVLETKKGLVVITGCAHPGIIEIIKKVKFIKNKPIYMVLGGFHLITKNNEDIAAIVKEMKDLGVVKCGASHCTGDNAIKAFKNIYKNDFVEIGAGKVINLD